jgi:undecaprenyl-diphosphatase
MRPPEPSVAETLALGLLQGPAELLPISSSAHVELVPWLLGWAHAELPGEARKEVEVALHAGTALALLAGGEWRARQWLGVIAFVPPALAALALERPIERRFGTPATIAAGLVAGSAIMAWADRTGPAHRRRPDAGSRDGLALGVAQAAALVPGVSRNGATLAAARARGFGREDANALSRHVALPVIVGATVLKGRRLLRRRRTLPPGTQTAFAAGAAAAFASTLGSTWVIGQVERDRSLTPYAAYRVALAGLVLRRLWQDRAR